MTESHHYTRLLKAALGLVLDGARIAEANSGARSLAQKESIRDIVTSADLAIDDLLTDGLLQTAIPIISEEREFNPSSLDAGKFWVIDPIDGTVNFAHKIPFFAVSIGLVDEGEFILGAVCAPDLDELYFTLSPSKALMNGQAFKHEHQASQDSLVAASFTSRSVDAEYALYKALNENTRGCLRTGSASLNICWAAYGKLQAAYGFRGKLWDVAGGLAIARAAGCIIHTRRHAGTPFIDYVVGSKDTVAMLMKEFTRLRLWEAA